MKKYSKSIICITLVIIMTLLFAGCSATKKAETTVNNTFEALKELDFEAASKYLDVNNIMDEESSDDIMSFDENVFMENLFGKLDHKIVSSEKIDDNTVVVKTEITAIDMAPVFKDYFGKALQYAFANAFADPQPSQEETNKKMEEIFVECVSKEDLAMVTNEVDIKVVKAEKEWKIESTDTLSDALLGGISKAVEEIGSAFAGLE